MILPSIDIIAAAGLVSGFLVFLWKISHLWTHTVDALDKRLALVEQFQQYYPPIIQEEFKKVHGRLEILHPANIASVVTDNLRQDLDRFDRKLDSFLRTRIINEETG